MTLSDITNVYDLVDELQQQGFTSVKVYEYVHTMTKKTLYAVFHLDRFCDIHESPYVTRPVLIYNGKTWLGVYEYLNHIED